MCLTLQPDAPLHRLSCPGFWIQEVFYWPAGNSGVKAGQKTDGYRRDKADVHCNVIHVATAWIMPAPIGPVAEEDFLVGAQKHHCCGCIFVRFTSAQDAAVVGKDLRGLSAPFFPQRLSVRAVLDRAASHHAQPQASPNHCLVCFPGDELFWSN